MPAPKMANANPVNPFHATTSGDPAKRLNNPLPLNNRERGLQITIEEDGWIEGQENFQERNPEFTTYENGHPKELADLWVNIQSIRDWILDSDWAGPFRAMIKDKIARTGPIRNAVCVGLGHPYQKGHRFRTRWAHQLAAFLATCKIIEEEKKITLPTPVHADPAFNLAAEYVIETLVGHIVVKDAFDGNHVDEQSFVYGIHLAFPAVADGLLAIGKHPELFIGPQINTKIGGVSFAIVEWFIKHAYMNRNVTLPARFRVMIDQALLFQSTHEKFEAKFDYEAEETGIDKKFFNDTVAWIRRKEPLDLKKMMDPTDEDTDEDGQSKGNETSEGSKDSQAGKGGSKQGEGEQSKGKKRVDGSKNPSVKQKSTTPQEKHTTNLADRLKKL